jgi:hypothetical protein
MLTGSAYASVGVVWHRCAEIPGDCFAISRSCQQRLPEDNTLIFGEFSAQFFKLTDVGETVRECYASGAVCRVKRYGSDCAGIKSTPLDDGA